MSQITKEQIMEKVKSAKEAGICVLCKCPNSDGICPTCGIKVLSVILEDAGIMDRKVVD